MLCWNKQANKKYQQFEVISSVPVALLERLYQIAYKLIFVKWSFFLEVICNLCVILC